MKYKPNALIIRKAVWPFGILSSVSSVFSSLFSSWHLQLFSNLLISSGKSHKHHFSSPPHLIICQPNWRDRAEEVKQLDYLPRNKTAASRPSVCDIIPIILTDDDSIILATDTNRIPPKLHSTTCLCDNHGNSIILRATCKRHPAF